MNTRLRSRFVFALGLMGCVSLWLGGCGATPTATQTSLPSPSASATPDLIATEVVRQLAVAATLTAMVPTATATPLPTRTSTPPPTASATPTLPVPTATPTPLPSTATPTQPTHTPTRTVVVPTSTPVAQLQISWDTIHYNCEGGCYSKNGTDWGPGQYIYAYRSFHLNMHVINLTKDKTVEPYWKPSFVLTDGVTEWVDSDPWRWTVVKGKAVGPQPAILPGATVDWTFLSMIPQRNAWVKAAVFDMWGTTYRIDFDLGPRGNNYDFKDCGEVLPKQCPGGKIP
jgi:hypothetical protein